MLGPEGRWRATRGLVSEGGSDVVILLHHATVLAVWPVDVGYPLVGDRDSMNHSRGERVATWRFTLPESMTLGNTITHARVSREETATSVIQEELPVPVAKVEGKQLILYVNGIIE